MLCNDLSVSSPVGAQADIIADLAFIASACCSVLWPSSLSTHFALLLLVIFTSTLAYLHGLQLLYTCPQVKKLESEVATLTVERYHIVQRPSMTMCDHHEPMSEKQREVSRTSFHFILLTLSVHAANLYRES
jgi:hypothetical protein